MIMFGTTEIERRFQFQDRYYLNLSVSFISQFYTWSDQMDSASFLAVFVNYRQTNNRIPISTKKYGTDTCASFSFHNIPLGTQKTKPT